MPLRNIFILTIAIFITRYSSAQKNSPVNAHSSPQVRKVLAFLYSIKGKNIISGQQNYNSDRDLFSDSVKAITGKYPGIWGSDFMNWGDKDLGQDIVNEAIQKWKDGYLVSLMWHEGKPTDNPPYEFTKNVLAKMTDAEWNELVTPGSALNNRWLAQIDVIAGYLKQLKDAGVPVLWRPYHEMNGVWFWWGNRKGENGIARLWKMMYDRFTNHFRLNNLIWVWGANGLRDIPLDEAYDYKDYYPGANYVDVLGADVYHFDYEQDDYNRLLKLANGKPIALTETGELPKPEILKAQPQWIWFMVWTSWLWTDNTHERVKQIYNLPQTLNHDEIKLKLLAY